MPEVEYPAKIPPLVPPINGWEDLLRAMGSKDDTDLDAVDNVQYEATKNIYIKDKTRYQYQGADKSILVWEFFKGYECVGDAASTELRNIFYIQKGASVRKKN